MPFLIEAISDSRIPGVLRMALKSLFKNKAINVELEGIRFRVFPARNHHDLAIARRKLFEEERLEFAFLERNLRPGDILIDVGANIGAISIPLAVRNSVKVIAFEPDPSNFDRLCYNVQLNGLTDFECIPAAVGHNGTLTLWINRWNFGLNSEHRWKKASSSIEVRSIALWDAIKEASLIEIAALKIDIEGAEDQALIPFFDKAPNHIWPKSISIEHYNSRLWNVDCLDYLQSKGYRLVCKSTMNSCLQL
jgi:FkbM family methyltransferase